MYLLFYLCYFLPVSPGPGRGLPLTLPALKTPLRELSLRVSVYPRNKFVGAAKDDRPEGSLAMRHNMLATRSMPSDATQFVCLHSKGRHPKPSLAMPHNTFYRRGGG